MYFFLCGGVLFLVFCFLSGFPESVLGVYFLFCWPAWLVCSSGKLAGVRGWGGRGGQCEVIGYSARGDPEDWDWGNREN